MDRVAQVNLTAKLGFRSYSCQFILALLKDIGRDLPRTAGRCCLYVGDRSIRAGNSGVSLAPPRPRSTLSHIIASTHALCNVRSCFEAAAGGSAGAGRCDGFRRFEAHRAPNNDLCAIADIPVTDDVSAPDPRPIGCFITWAATNRDCGISSPCYNPCVAQDKMRCDDLCLIMGNLKGSKVNYEL